MKEIGELEDSREHDQLQLKDEKHEVEERRVDLLESVFLNIIEGVSLCERIQ